MAAPSSKATAAAATKLGVGGKLFFGSLCAGTFGLGCWQLRRLTEKQSLMDEREEELSMPPTAELDGDRAYRRRLLQGTFRHDKEVLVGPRGAPLGVQIPGKGLSAGTAGGGGGAPGPQGFHVLTPLQLSHDSGQQQRSAVWINRGWVPKTIVPNSDGRGTDAHIPYPQWNRPQGNVQVTAVVSKTETPKFITPEHNYSLRPLRLFWLDKLALQAISGKHDEETMLLVQIKDEEEKDNASSSSSSSSSSRTDKTVQYPLRPALDDMSQFQVTPAVHAGYAATWFGLSGAGVYMLRKLITKGR